MGQSGGGAGETRGGRSLTAYAARGWPRREGGPAEVVQAPTRGVHVKETQTVAPDPIPTEDQASYASEPQWSSALQVS